MRQINIVCKTIYKWKTSKSWLHVYCSGTPKISSGATGSHQKPCAVITRKELKLTATGEILNISLFLREHTKHYGDQGLIATSPGQSSGKSFFATVRLAETQHCSPSPRWSLLVAASCWEVILFSWLLANFFYLFIFSISELYMSASYFIHESHFVLGELVLIICKLCNKNPTTITT